MPTDPQLSDPESVVRFARALDSQEVDLDLLGDPLRTPSDPRHHLALLAIERCAAAAEDATTLRRWAAALPRTPATKPASSIILAGLYRRLWRWLPAPQVPDWRADGVEVEVEVEVDVEVGVRLAWIRTEACVTPAFAGRCDDPEALNAALDGLTLEEVDDPLGLIEALSGRSEPVHQARALDLLRNAVDRAALTPEDAHRIARKMLRGSPLAVLRGLNMLAETWSHALPLRAEELRCSPGSGEAIARAALGCALSRGVEGPLRAVLEDDDAPPRLRQDALRGLGHLVERPAIAALLEHALADPLLLAKPCLDALATLHERGLFIADDQVSPLLELYARAPGYPAKELVDLGYTSRWALFSALCDAPPKTLDRPRQVELALCLAQAPRGARPLPVTPWLISVCAGEGDDKNDDDDDDDNNDNNDEDDNNDDGATAAALLALARLGAPEAERLALAILPRDAAAALDALRYAGDRATVQALLAGLGIAPPGPVSAALLPHTGAAAQLLWQLSADDRSARERILDRLGVDEISPAILRDLGSGLSPQESAIIRRQAQLSAGGSRPLQDKIAAIGELVRLHQASLLPQICDHLRQIIDAVDAGAVFDESLRGEAQRVVPAPVIASLRGLGAWLKEHGRVRPVVLLDAANEDAGDVFAAECLLTLVPEWTGDASREGGLAVLLRSLAELDAPRIYPVVLPLLRSDSPMIRKLVIPMIARYGGRALATSLRVRSEDEDIETVRRALIALGEVGDTGIGPTLAAALEHRNMNIKKSAAAALARVRAPSTIPRLLWWLGHHDNPGLRAHLVDGLREMLGSTMPMTILAAVATAEDPRRRGLLLDALGELDVLSLRAAVRGESPWLEALLDRIDRGELRLRGRLGPLAAELEEAGLRPPPAPSPSSSSERPQWLRTLENDTWTGEIEADLLATRRRRSLTADERSCLQPYLPRWLELTAAAPSSTLQEHLRIAVDLLPQQPSKTLVKLLRPHLQLLARGLAAAESPLAAELLLCVERLCDELPAPTRWLFGSTLRRIYSRPRTDHTGRSHLSLLRRCGLVLGRDDVEAALASAERCADPPALQRRILADAFFYDEGARTSAPSSAIQRSLKAAALTRDPEALLSLRTSWSAPPAPTIAGLIALYVDADAGLRPSILDWLCDLQPPSAPLLGDRPAADPPSPRRPRATDLDQPLSAALLERLRLQLDSASSTSSTSSTSSSDDTDDDPSEIQRRRCSAATELLAHADRLEPELCARLLQHFLRGELGAAGFSEHRLLAPLAQALARGPTPPVGEHSSDRPWLGRLRQLVTLPQARACAGLLEALIDAWAHAVDDREARDLLREMINTYDPHRLRVAVQAPILAGDWGYLDLLRPPLRPSTLDDALLAAVVPDKRDALAARIDLLRRPSISADTTSASPEPTIPAAPQRSREELYAELRAVDRRSDPEPLVAGLKVLSRAADADFVALCRELVSAPQPRLRLAAYRHLRRHGSREDSLRAARELLDDPRPDVQRSAIASLGHARDPSALPQIIDRLRHRNNGVRNSARAALKLYGEAAKDGLALAIRSARPDHRRKLQEIAAELGDGPSDDGRS